METVKRRVKLETYLHNFFREKACLGGQSKQAGRSKSLDGLDQGCTVTHLCMCMFCTRVCIVVSPTH